MENQQSFEGREDLLVADFTQAQIEQLTRLRSLYIEKAQKQMMEEQHRLEFARWLVLHGRLTDGFPSKRHKGFQSHHLYTPNRENQDTRI